MITEIKKDVKVETIHGVGHYAGWVEIDVNSWRWYYKEITDWCLNTIGVDMIDETWHMAGNRFYFVKEEDMSSFVLRWA